MQKIGNQNHWFGDYYLSGGQGAKYILFNPSKPLSKVIELKAKTYTEALREAKIYGGG